MVKNVCLPIFARKENFFQKKMFFEKHFFSKEPQQQNLLKSNECLILKLENHVGYVNSPTRKGGSQIQSRTSADGYPDSLIKINEILDFDRFSDGP